MGWTCSHSFIRDEEVSWIEIGQETVTAPRLVTRAVIGAKGEVMNVATKQQAGTHIVTVYKIWSCWSCKFRAVSTGGYSPGKCCCGAQ